MSLRQAEEGASEASPGGIAFWLVVLAFTVRIGFLLILKTYRFDHYRFDDYSFNNEITRISRSIAEGHGFSSPFSAEYTGPTAWIAPIYPYLCALFFACFGVLTERAAIALLTLQSAFSALTCIPILGIAQRTVGRRAGLAAAFLWAVFPWFSKWPLSWVWDISLSALLFTCLFWYALRLAEPAGEIAWMGFGALWGFALLVNPALLTLFPISLLWCAAQLHRRGRTWMKPAMLALFACALVISPWLIRNRVVFGQWIFLRSNFGYELWLGNAQGTSPRGWDGPHPSRNLAELATYKNMGEPAYVHRKTADFLASIRLSKWQFARVSAMRVIYFWDGSAMGYRRQIAWYWQPWSFAALSLLLLPAMLVAHRKQLHAWRLCFGALLVYPLPYYLTFSQVRYRHVLEPLMLLLVCFAAAETLAPLRRRRWPNSVAAQKGPAAL